MTFSWRCPYCQHNATIGDANVFVVQSRTDKAKNYGPLVIVSQLIVCPNPKCSRIKFSTGLYDALNPNQDSSSHAYNARGMVQHAWSTIIPGSKARPFPDYVPATILADYNEACAIESLSPKASATLARRCVQGIIRGFYGVSKGRLIDEIDAIETKVDTKVFAAIHALRELGNIGAHPEKDINVIVDVDPDEARALIDLVELLIDETYVADHERQKRLDVVAKAAAAKKALKSAPATPALPPSTKKP